MNRSISLPAILALVVGAVLLTVLFAPIFFAGGLLAPHQQREESEFDICRKSISGSQFGAEGVTAKVPYRVNLTWEPVKSESPILTDGRFSVVFSDWKTEERISSDVAYDFIFKGQSDVRELHDRVATGGLDTFEVESMLHPCSLNFMIHIDSVGDAVIYDPTGDPEYDVATHGTMSPVFIQFQMVQAPTGITGMKSITRHVIEVIIPEGSSSPDSEHNNFESAVIRVVIGVNNTVRWINQDLTSGSVVANDKGDPDFYDSTWDDVGNPKVLLDPGETFEFTFTKPGEFDYHSVPHPWKHGTVIVLAPEL